jgi:hypothetical protein
VQYASQIWPLGFSDNAAMAYSAPSTIPILAECNRGTAWLPRRPAKNGTALVMLLLADGSSPQKVPDTFGVSKRCHTKTTVDRRGFALLCRQAIEVSAIKINSHAMLLDRNLNRL